MKKSPTPDKCPESRGSKPAESPPQVNGREYEILVKLKDGDPEAFKEVFGRWDKTLYQFLLRLTGSVEDAEDISQEAFITLWQYRGSIDPTRNIRNYILLIGKQIAWKHINGRQNSPGIVFGEIPDTEGDVSYDKIMEAEELELLTEHRIEKMPPRTREIYNLHYKENMTYEQIAEKLGTNRHVVKTRIAEARHFLRDVFTLSAFVFLLDFLSNTSSW